MMVQRQMHLGVFVLGTGNHIAGWRWPGAFDTFESLPVVQAIARTAERGLFDLLFLGDGLAADPSHHPSFTTRLEPITMLSALAATTTHVGLGATASTTYGEPFTVARAFASLDHLSGGRAAWNAVTSSNPDGASNFGRAHPPHAQRYVVAEEFVDVVRGLWDCWEDGAVVKNLETGQYIDPAKVHALNHKGTYFDVKGPLNISRCPQGRPVVLQAGASDAGLALAARTADVVFAVVQDHAEAQAGYAALKGRMAAFGRNPDTLSVLPGVMPIIGGTMAEARRTLDTLQSFVSPTNAIKMLSTRLGTDMSVFPMDGPVPDLPLPDTSHGFARAMLSKARRDGMTLRDLYNLTGAARGHWVLVGTPETVADTLVDWFTTHAADGFNILPATFPQAFDAFVDEVVPHLQRRGVYRTAYEGTTLRDHLGLPRG
jgi:FMN-dependent oxidoreductase (nitrilotriacetate monooxygenase family)